jgi:hypothetical protein
VTSVMATPVALYCRQLTRIAEEFPLAKIDCLTTEQALPGIVAVLMSANSS